jgi:glycosyltransferase involved in cell wall biosynthesis
MSSDQRIAVIIPARNAMATLPACLDALMRSSRKPDEIIIFDDGLNCNIGEYAKVDRISIVSNGGVQAGAAKGRNIAARNATADVLAFVDADVVVETEALGRLVAVLGSESDVVAAFGSYDDAPRVKRLTALYGNLRHHWIHQHGDQEAATFWTGLGVVRADVFWALDGFDEACGIDDVDLGMRIHAAGGQIRLVPDAQCTHLKDWRLFQLWRTDVTNRAYPWSLLMARGTRSNQLNVSPRERFSAVLAYGFLLSLIGSYFASWLWLDVVILAGLYVFLNRGLFRLIAKRGGARALLTGIVLHWLYHLYASAIFVAVQLTVKTRAVFSTVRRGLVKRVMPAVAILRLPRKRLPNT